jgi:hypothetical protein
MWPFRVTQATQRERLLAPIKCAHSTVPVSLNETAVVNGYYHSASRAAQYATDFRWHMICFWIPGEYWSPGKICYWSPGKFLPALSALRHPAGPPSAAGPARLEIPANDDRQWRQRNARRRPGRIRRIHHVRPN